MKVTHHFTTEDPAELMRRKIEIHRKCLLRLYAQARPGSSKSRSSKAC